MVTGRESVTYELFKTSSSALDHSPEDTVGRGQKKISKKKKSFFERISTFVC